MSAEILSIGVAGVGRWGRNILRNLTALEGCRVEAVYDPAPAGREQAAHLAPSARLVDSFEALLESGVSAVTLATPAQSHYELARRALGAGLHVFVEKPLALEVSQGEELVETAGRKGLILLVGHVLRYHPALDTVLRAVRGAELGRVYTAHAERLNFGRVRAAENVIWSLGPHDILNLVMVFGEWPTAVACVAGSHIREGICDHAQLNLFFSGGRSATALLSWLNPNKRRELTLIGELGMLHWDDVRGVVELHPKWAEALVDADGRPLTEHHDYAVRELPIEPGEPLARELAHFVDCCLGREAPTGDGVEGLKILRVLEAADASAARGGAPVALGG